jgi:hypothetical protein
MGLSYAAMPPRWWHDHVLSYERKIILVGIDKDGQETELMKFPL